MNAPDAEGTPERWYARSYGGANGSRLTHHIKRHICCRRTTAQVMAGERGGAKRQIYVCSAASGIIPLSSIPNGAARRYELAVSPPSNGAAHVTNQRRQPFRQRRGSMDSVSQKAVETAKKRNVGCQRMASVFCSVTITQHARPEAPRKGTDQRHSTGARVTAKNPSRHGRK